MSNSFSSEEAREILQRAAALQDLNPQELQDLNDRLSEDELTKAAEEIGIRSTFLRRAIREQVPSNGEYIATLDGERGLDEVLSVLVGNTPAPQWEPKRIGKTVKALYSTGIDLAEVLVTTREGRTDCRARLQPQGSACMAFFVALAAVAGFLLPTGGTLIAPWPVFVVTLLAATFGSYWWFVKVSRRRMERLLRDIARQVRDLPKD